MFITKLSLCSYTYVWYSIVRSYSFTPVLFQTFCVFERDSLPRWKLRVSILVSFEVRLKEKVDGIRSETVYRITGRSLKKLTKFIGVGASRDVSRKQLFYVWNVTRSCGINFKDIEIVSDSVSPALSLSLSLSIYLSIYLSLSPSAQSTFY